MTPFITVDGLRKRHGPSEVLRGTSLSVPKGKVAAVIGPSGGGKSTLLRCINGLEAFEAGSVAVGDLRLAAGTVRDEGLLRAVRTRVGFVFQQFNLFPHLSVLDNLCLAPRLVRRETRADAEGRARALLTRVGMGEKAGARPRDLSGGQQQRVAIARALMMEPECVLFDEPTSALDPVMAAEVIRVIEDLSRSQMTMIVVTHSMSFARRIADEVLVCAGGTVVERGPPERLFGQPEHEVTRSFLAQTG